MCEARDCNRDAGEPLGRGPSAPKVFFVKCVFVKWVLLFCSAINIHPLPKDRLVNCISPLSYHLAILYCLFDCLS